MLQQYVDQVYDFLQQIGVFPLMCTIVSYATVYGLLVYGLMALVFLVGKLTKGIRVRRTELGMISAASLFGFVFSLSGFVLSYQKAIAEPWGGLIGYISVVIRTAIREPSIASKLILIVLMVLTLLLLALFLAIVLVCLAGFWKTIRAAIELNGVFLGILVGIYEIYSGFFWIACILAVLSISAAVLLLPIVVIYSNKRVIFVEVEE